jgi:hypothetical protein
VVSQGFKKAARMDIVFETRIQPKEVVGDVYVEREVQASIMFWA